MGANGFSVIYTAKSGQKIFGKFYWATYRRVTAHPLLKVVPKTVIDAFLNPR